ncbi:MAG: hypothetical protein D6731_16465, partial [Planctomycetota bacterium]
MCLGAVSLCGLLGCGADTPPERPEDESPELVREATPERFAEQAYARGREAEGKGDYARAQEAYREAQSHVPGFRDTDARLEALEAIVAARREYEQAKTEGILGDEQMALLEVHYANALRQGGPGLRNLHGARILLERAARRAPNDPRVRLALALVDEERGDLSAAVARCEDAAAAESAEAHYQAAFLYRTCLEGDGPDPNKALEHARKAVELASPPQPHYYELLALCHYDLGELDAAIEALNEACRLSDDPRYRKRLDAYVYERDGPAPDSADDAMPGEDMPGEDMPGEDMPGDDDLPGDDTPADDDLPGDDLPGDDTPADDTPAGDDTPGDDLPGDDTPGDDTPGDDLPGDDLPGDDLPGD